MSDEPYVAVRFPENHVVFRMVFDKETFSTKPRDAYKALSERVQASVREALADMKVEVVEELLPEPRDDDYGSAEDKAFVRAWLTDRKRPGFALRAGAPYVDWEAWAAAIREGWITDDGFWNE